MLLVEVKKAFFDVLLYASTSFSISQVMVGEMFMFFRCQMCRDKEVFVEFISVGEVKFMVVYSLFYNTLRGTYALLDWIVGFYSGSVHYIFL